MMVIIFWNKDVARNMIKFILCALIIYVSANNFATAQEMGPAYPDPSWQIVIGGDAVFGVTDGHLLRHAPTADDPTRWVAIDLPEHFALAGPLVCSVDGEGDCAIEITRGDARYVGLLRSGSAALETSSFQVDDLIGLDGLGRIFAVLDNPDRGRVLVSIDAATGERRELKRPGFSGGGFI